MSKIYDLEIENAVLKDGNLSLKNKCSHLEDDLARLSSQVAALKGQLQETQSRADRQYEETISDIRSRLIKNLDEKLDRRRDSKAKRDSNGPSFESIALPSHSPTSDSYSGDVEPISPSLEMPEVEKTTESQYLDTTQDEKQKEFSNLQAKKSATLAQSDVAFSTDPQLASPMSKIPKLTTLDLEALEKPRVPEPSIGPLDCEKVCNPPRRLDCIVQLHRGDLLGGFHSSIQPSLYIDTGIHGSASLGLSLFTKNRSKEVGKRRWNIDSHENDEFIVQKLLVTRMKDQTPDHPSYSSEIVG